jgi:hypothetical protein
VPPGPRSWSTIRSTRSWRSDRPQASGTTPRRARTRTRPATPRSWSSSPHRGRIWMPRMVQVACAQLLRSHENTLLIGSGTALDRSFLCRSVCTHRALPGDTSR